MAEPEQSQNNNDQQVEVIKHPLEHSWTLSYFELNKQKNWMDCMHNVYTFNTVEDFWCLYNYILPCNELPHGCDYYLFKTGIKPMWEDEKNKRGGRWLLNTESRQRSNLAKLWLHTILYMIGENFDEYGEEVCGAVVNVRGKGDKINLWTGDCSNREAIIEIGERWKSSCFSPDTRLMYEPHADNASKSGSRVNALYYI